MTMISWRPKVILWTMVILTVVLGAALFLFPPGSGWEHKENPGPHVSEQTAQ